MEIAADRRHRRIRAIRFFFFFSLIDGCVRSWLAKRKKRRRGWLRKSAAAPWNIIFFFFFVLSFANRGTFPSTERWNWTAGNETAFRAFVTGTRGIINDVHAPRNDPRGQIAADSAFTRLRSLLGSCTDSKSRFLSLERRKNFRISAERRSRFSPIPRFREREHRGKIYN